MCEYHQRQLFIDYVIITVSLFVCFISRGDRKCQEIVILYQLPCVFVS